MTKSVARLIEQFAPEHYTLDIKPDRETMTFTGVVSVRGKKTGRPSQRLTFHQKELDITNATITRHDKKGDITYAVSRINNQNSQNEVRLHAREQLYAGEYSITMTFNGRITKPMNGIYPCFFRHDEKDKIIIATQFESHHAREAFPCIDEPEAKATFDLILTTPAGETVIANTPIKTQSTVQRHLQVTEFERTPRMSTYLLAFAYGDLDFSEAKTKDGVVVRAYATPDNVRLTNHGLGVAVRALEFFSDYFGVAYPLPKLDMLALPDFSSGAMENWGLVTYRETTMLADDDSSSIESKQLVALVICHELSHQWFGNLVTMRWWDDLWLNESFANLMEYRAVDALYPEWHIWEQFVNTETASAKRRDSLLDVQPIHTDVHHPDEISTLFDPSIVYAKGGSVLRMLMSYIGEDNFRTGLKAYFEAHSYKNTEAHDLWLALSSVTHQDISAFMADWLNLPGYPLVRVGWQPAAKTVSLEQKRFVTDASYDDKGVLSGWQVPLASTVELSSNVLANGESSLEVKNPEAGPLIFNHDGQSYFIPKYDNTEHVQSILLAIKAGSVDVIDRLLLLDNYTMLQRGGVATTTELLDLLPAYEHETEESVWSSLAIALGEVRRLIEGDKVQEARLHTFTAKLVLATVERLGWDDQTDDSAQTLRLRGLIVSLAAGARVDSVLKEGNRRFDSFKKPGDLSPTIRQIVYYVGVRYGADTKANYKKLLQLHNKTTSADERDELASALTSAKQKEQYDQSLALLTTKQIRRQDLLHWYVWLLRNQYSREAAWDWLVSHWDWIENEFRSDKSYSFFARYAGSVFSTPADLEKFQSLFEAKKTDIALHRDISLGEQEIMSRVAWRSRNEAAVRQWLAANS